MKELTDRKINVIEDYLSNNIDAINNNDYKKLFNKDNAIKFSNSIIGNDEFFIPGYLLSYFNSIGISTEELLSEIDYIPPYMFYKDNIKSFKIPDNIKTICDSAFLECEDLIEIELPKNLNKIEMFSFGQCRNLENVYIPEGTEIIDLNAFIGCTSLRMVYIPDTIKKCSSASFTNCDNANVSVPKDFKEDLHTVKTVLRRK